MRARGRKERTDLRSPSKKRDRTTVRSPAKKKSKKSKPEQPPINRHAQCGTQRGEDESEQTHSTGDIEVIVLDAEADEAEQAEEAEQAGAAEMTEAEQAGAAAVAQTEAFVDVEVIELDAEQADAEADAEEAVAEQAGAAEMTEAEQIWAEVLAQQEEADAALAEEEEEEGAAAGAVVITKAMAQEAEAEAKAEAEAEAEAKAEQALAAALAEQAAAQAALEEEEEEGAATITEAEAEAMEAEAEAQEAEAEAQEEAVDGLARVVEIVQDDKRDPRLLSLLSSIMTAPEKTDHEEFEEHLVKLKETEKKYMKKMLADELYSTHAHAPASALTSNTANTACVLPLTGDGLLDIKSLHVCLSCLDKRHHLSKQCTTCNALTVTGLKKFVSSSASFGIQLYKKCDGCSCLVHLKEKEYHSKFCQRVADGSWTPYDTSV